MKVIFNFADTVQTSAVSGLSAASAYDGIQELILTPTGSWDLISAAGGGQIPDDAYREFYIDIPVISAGANLLGPWSIVASSLDSEYATKMYDPIPDIRDLNSNAKSELIMTWLSGSEVVNTTLNEMVKYADDVNIDGSIDIPKSEILMRYKLYDAQGNSTSINPVEKQAFNSALQTWINNYISGAGSKYL